MGSIFGAKPTSNVSSMESLTTPSAKASVYVVEKLLAQRISPEGVKYLVLWEGYTLEEDWTWELEKMLRDNVPDILEEWKTREKEPIVDEVEKIMSKRKVKGIPHYLVKWKWYDLVKDRTWEPCDRLEVDVPLIVDAYEEKKKRKK